METQIKLGIQLVNQNNERIGAWTHIKLPEYMVAKEKNKSVNAKNVGMYPFFAMFMCASDLFLLFCGFQKDMYPRPGLSPNQTGGVEREKKIGPHHQLPRSICPKAVGLCYVCCLSQQTRRKFIFYLHLTLDLFNSQHQHTSTNKQQQPLSPSPRNITQTCTSEKIVN